MTLNETIQEQKDIIEKENKKLQTLLELDLNKPITNYYLYEIIKTPIYNNKTIMCNIISLIFPMATDIKHGYKTMTFNIKGFIIYMNTSQMSTKIGITVKSEPIPIRTCNYDSEDKFIEFLKHYIELIDTKASWWKKAKYRNNGGYKKWILPFIWFFKMCPRDKELNRNRQWYVDMLDEKNKLKQDEYDKYIERYNKFVDRWNIYFNEVEPILLKFTDNVSDREIEEIRLFVNKEK